MRKIRLGRGVTVELDTLSKQLTIAEIIKLEITKLSLSGEWQWSMIRLSRTWCYAYGALNVLQ